MEATRVPAGNIVVGIDGSTSSDRALLWAVEQATVEHRPLVIVHSVQYVGMSRVGFMDASGSTQERAAEELTYAAEGMLANAESHAQHLSPDLEIHQVLDHSDPRVALLEQSRGAAVLVVGSRGRGPVASLLLGSVSVAVSKHAECPVVVVRSDEKHAHREGIAVAVYGTPQDEPVVDFAYRLASLHAVPLTVVHCFWDGAQRGASEREIADDEPGFDDLRLILTEAVKASRAKFDDVEDRLRLVRDFSDQELIRSSQTMALVVVGSQLTSRLQEIVYGSLAPTVIEHAHCPVAVVPTTASE